MVFTGIAYPVENIADRPVGPYIESDQLLVLLIEIIINSITQDLPVDDVILISWRFGQKILEPSFSLNTCVNFDFGYRIGIAYGLVAATVLECVILHIRNATGTSSDFIYGTLITAPCVWEPYETALLFQIICLEKKITDIGCPTAEPSMPYH